MHHVHAAKLYIGMIRRFPRLVGGIDMGNLPEPVGLPPDLDFVEAPPLQNRNGRLDKFVKAEGEGDRLAVHDPCPRDQRARMINLAIPLPVLPARRTGNAFIQRFHDLIDGRISGHGYPILSLATVRHHETGLFAPQAAFAYSGVRLPRSVQSAVIRTVGA